MSVSDPVNFECSGCGFAGPAYYTAHASGHLGEEERGLTFTIGSTEAECAARARALSEARAEQQQAVALASCPVCERVSESAQARLKGELFWGGVRAGAAFGVTAFPFVAAFLSWSWAVGTTVLALVVGTLRGIGDFARLQRRGSEVSFEAPATEPEQAEDEVERWFEMLKNS